MRSPAGRLDPGMTIHSTVEGITPDDVRDFLSGLPEAPGYDTWIKPLRYRNRPHLSGFTEFEDKRITLQVPVPFFAFGEIVHYGAKRMPAKGMRFVWLSEGLTFREPREVLRFLWCHEWYHWFLYEVLGRKSAAETACDRFALRNYLKPVVTLDDAHAALRRSPGEGA